MTTELEKLLLLRDKMEEAGMPRTFNGADRISEAQLLRTIYKLLVRIEALENHVARDRNHPFRRTEGGFLHG